MRSAYAFQKILMFLGVRSYYFAFQHLVVDDDLAGGFWVLAMNSLGRERIAAWGVDDREQISFSVL